jgi:hypothetical protein
MSTPPPILPDATKQILAKLDDLKADMKSMDSNFKGELQSMERKIEATMKAKMDDHTKSMNSSLNRISDNIGHLWEATARRQVHDSHGGSYAKPLLIRSAGDITAYVNHDLDSAELQNDLTRLNEMGFAIIDKLINNCKTHFSSIIAKPISLVKHLQAVTEEWVGGEESLRSAVRALRQRRLSLTRTS